MEGEEIYWVEHSIGATVFDEYMKAYHRDMKGCDVTWKSSNGEDLIMVY